VTAVAAGPVASDASAALARVTQLEQMIAQTASGFSVTTPSGGSTAGAGTFATLLASASPATSGSAVTTPTGYGPYASVITQAAARYGIDPALLYGVISQESGFNPSAVSSAGAQGIAQIMPSNLAGLGVTNAFDPVQSINAGAKMLSDNLKTFGGNTVEAVAAYNAGVGAVQRYGGVPPYAETQNYVKQVLAYAAQYPGSAAVTPTASPTGLAV